MSRDGAPAIRLSSCSQSPLPTDRNRFVGGLDPCSGLSALGTRALPPQQQQQVMQPRPRLSRCTNMAAGERRNVAVLACVLCLFLGQATSVDGKSFPAASTVKEWASVLRDNLVTLLNTLTGYHAINGSYNDAKTLHGAVFQKVDSQKLVEKMAEELSKMLSKKMDALWLLVHAAEEAAKNYTYNPQLKREQVSYYNSKNIHNLDLEFDNHFSQYVNFNFSSVHIPVEIYDGDAAILNGLQWTAALDDHFRKNYEQDKQMMWQFFGSQTGFMRTYPASRWNTHGQVDLFDVRRQSWYTQGSSSPKDMMILIDTSGSTHGQALQLMKNAVKSILDTLGENDFVNIVEFSQEARFVSECFNHTSFVQANYRNKKQLEKDVDKLKAQFQANYQVGLRFAFERFAEFGRNVSDGEPHVGANCNKVIILLTDGGTDNAKSVFEQYNWPNKSVRVFTYAVGPTATPVAAIKWMACANRGYFSQIPAMGAIRARVQDFLVVLSRPLALAHVENTQWTSSHKTPLTNNLSEYTYYLKQGMEQLGAQPVQWEITVEPREYIPVLSRPQVLQNAKAFEWGNIYKDHLGLGMMTTVTLPVYNRTLGSSNQTILGVMGIDVSTKELGKHTPYMQIGPAGYAFAINPNGYAVFHPNLKRSGRYMKDPPNIDILELELEQSNDSDFYSGEYKGKLMELRGQMIDGYRSMVQIPKALFLTPDKKYVSIQSATYAFTNITNTTFRLGLSVPDFQQWYPQFYPTSLPDIIYTASPDDPAFLIAPWEYLGTLFPPETLNSSLTSLVAVLKSGQVQANNLTAEQLQLLHHLAVDVQVGMTIQKYLSLIKHKNSSSNSSLNEEDDDVNLHGFNLSGLLLHFMAMNGGLTVVYPPSEAGQFKDDLDITNSTYYKRAMFSTDYMFTTDSNSYNRTHPAVMAFRSVSVERHNHRIAVTGVKLEAERLRDFVFTVLKNKTLRDGSVNTMLTCEDVDEVVCYLVDDGGFLVISNQDNETFTPGLFLGEVDPQLWLLLRGKDVYGRSVEYDFLAMCAKEKDTTSAGGRSFFVPSLSMLYETLTTSWWTSKVSWAYASFNIYNWLFGTTGAYGQEEELDVDEVILLDENKEEECVKAIKQFYLNPHKAQLSSNVSCGMESRLVETQPMLGTNLLLILTELPCSTDIKLSDYEIHRPTKVDEEEEKELVCSLSRHPRRRVQSYGCYDNDPKEDVSQCGTAALPNGKVLASFTACVTIIAVWLLSGDHR